MESPNTLVIIFLPVEAVGSYQYGDPYELARTHDLAKAYDALLVFPDFEHIPWYADHPTMNIHQETYMVGTFLQEIDQIAETSVAPAQRLLLGYSKSGWGAVTLLLRHPHIFGRAAAGAQTQSSARKIILSNTA